MMNRYLQGKTDEQTGPKKLRPFIASECADLQEADKWHHQIVREISRKVYEIQNAGLGEHRCVQVPLHCRAAKPWHAQCPAVQHRALVSPKLAIVSMHAD